MRKRLTITNLQQMKEENNKLTVMTAYDYPSAMLSEEAGVDIILVGDSLGNVVLGYDTTLPVTLDDMIYHTKAVARGARHTFIVTDMPFMTYGIGREATLRNAARMMQEGGGQSLKLEGGEEIAGEVAALVKAGIPVMGHIGLKPQSIHTHGGFKVQGKQEAEAEQILRDAKALEQAGAYAIVLELVTETIADRISRELSIPTIGIGAGRGCDGQVLVYHDILQYSSPVIKKKMVKVYADIGSTIRDAIGAFVSEVKSGEFPAEEHVFGKRSEDAVDSLYGGSATREHVNGVKGTGESEQAGEGAEQRDFVPNHR